MNATKKRPRLLAASVSSESTGDQCGRVSNPCRPCRPSSCPSSCPCRELLVNCEPRNVERTRNDSRSTSDSSIVGESRATGTTRAAATTFSAGRTQRFLEGYDVAAIVQRDGQSADVDNLLGCDLPIASVPAENASRDADKLGRLARSQEPAIVGADFVGAAFSLPCCLLCHCDHLADSFVPVDRPTYAARWWNPISAINRVQVNPETFPAADSPRPAGCGSHSLPVLFLAI